MTRAPGDASETELIKAGRKLRKGASGIRINIKQWEMLHAVAECGSYANAAQFLDVTQPAVSYTIAKLEEQLGMSLLRIEGRKAQITPPGSLLLARSQALLREAIELEELATKLREGRKPEIKLAVSKTFPPDMLTAALRNFVKDDPGARFQLIEASGAKLERILHERGADLAVCDQLPPGFDGDFLMRTEYVAVAHPDHHLFRLDRPVMQTDLVRELQVVISDEDGSYESGRVDQIESLQRWEVSSFDTARRVLVDGFGFAWLPRHYAQDFLESGALRELRMQRQSMYTTCFYLIHGRACISGSDVGTFARVLRELATCREEGGRTA